MKRVVLLVLPPANFEIHRAVVDVPSPMSREDVLKNLVPREATRSRPMRTSMSEGLFACTPSCDQSKKLIAQLGAQGVHYDVMEH